MAGSAIVVDVSIRPIDRRSASRHRAGPGQSRDVVAEFVEMSPEEFRGVAPATTSSFDSTAPDSRTQRPPRGYERAADSNRGLRCHYTKRRVPCVTHAGILAVGAALIEAEGGWMTPVPLLRSSAISSFLDGRFRGPIASRLMQRVWSSGALDHERSIEGAALAQLSPVARCDCRCNLGWVPPAFRRKESSASPLSSVASEGCVSVFHSPAEKRFADPTGRSTGSSGVDRDHRAQAYRLNASPAGERSVAPVRANALATAFTDANFSPSSVPD